VATNMQARALWKSLALHAVILGAVLSIPAGPLRRSVDPDEVEVEFHPPAPPPVEARVPVMANLPKIGTIPSGPKTGQRAPAAPASVPAAPVASTSPGLPEGAPEVPVAEPPQEKIGKSGILAFKDQIASVADDKNSVRLGAMAHLKAAAEATSSSPRDYLLNAVPGGSGGINAAALTRSVGGGGGGTGGGGMQGIAVGRATDSLAGIGGGGGRGRSLGGGGGAGGAGGTGGASVDGTPGHGGPGNARTDEEIQIVFDRHKASFYRLYHQQLRNDPTLKGQIVLRLTIEPDGSVSMCALQSTDMHAPDLAAQVVERVRSINFGAKEGVAALTIVYPIDFLPAA
jgi:hypothetical protein